MRGGVKGSVLPKQTEIKLSRVSAKHRKTDLKKNIYFSVKPSRNKTLTEQQRLKHNILLNYCIYVIWGTVNFQRNNFMNAIKANNATSHEDQSVSWK